ncbi:MAG: YgaP family membrane protein [Burkholderiales bacterium]
MKTNVGSVDKIVRVVVGIGLLSLFFILEGNMRFLGLIGIVPIATALMGWCPLYSVIGVNTCPLTEKKS